MTSNQKCKIAKGLEKTGKIVGPPMFFGSLLAILIQTTIAGIRSYRLNPSDFLKGAAGVAAVLSVWGLLMFICFQVSSFIDRNKASGC